MTGLNSSTCRGWTELARGCAQLCQRPLPFLALTLVGSLATGTCVSAALGPGITLDVGFGTVVVPLVGHLVFAFGVPMVPSRWYRFVCPQTLRVFVFQIGEFNSR